MSEKTENTRHEQHIVIRPRRIPQKTANSVKESGTTGPEGSLSQDSITEEGECHWKLTKPDPQLTNAVNIEQFEWGGNNSEPNAAEEINDRTISIRTIEKESIVQLAPGVQLGASPR